VTRKRESVFKSILFKKASKVIYSKVWDDKQFNFPKAVIVCVRGWTWRNISTTAVYIIYESLTLHISDNGNSRILGGQSCMQFSRAINRKCFSSRELWPSIAAHRGKTCMGCSADIDFETKVKSIKANFCFKILYIIVIIIIKCKISAKLVIIF